MPRITKRAVEALQPATEPPLGSTSIPDIMVWDDELRGFGVQVKPSGVRSYIVQYRRKTDGKSRRLTIGQHGPVMAEQARSQAKALLGDIARGADPLGDRQAIRDSARTKARTTVSHVIDEFIDRYAKGHTKSWQETRRLFDKEVVPHWGERDITEITRRDVLDLLDGIMDRGAPYTANRALAAIRKLFNWCIERGIVEATPATRITKPGAEQERDRVLSDNELRTLWAAWDRQGWPFGPLFQLLLVTGQRRNEVAGMHWADVDLEGRVWRLPREQTKAGRGHEAPLSPLALTILDKLPRMGELVFPDQRHGRNPVSGFSKAKSRCDQLCEDAILDWRLHDLRRTCGTNLARLGFSRDIIKRVLNHAGDRDVTDIYDRHGYLPEKREALDAWASELERIFGTPTNNVIPLSRNEDARVGAY